MIHVAGEALVDLLVDPSGGVRAVLGGGPFNAARTVGRLGHPCRFIGRISNDRFGRLIAAALAADSVDQGVAERTDLPTTLAAAELDENGSASYRFYLADTSAILLDAHHLPAQPGARVDAVHVGSLALVAEPIATTLLGWLGALDGNSLVMVDLNARPHAVGDHAHYRRRLGQFIQLAHIVKASTDDLEFLDPDVAPLVAAQHLVDRGAHTVLITDGGAPVRVLTTQGARTIAVPNVEVVDTIGAGDAFGAAVLTWWVEHGLGVLDAGDLDALSDAVTFGALVSAVTCTRAGADPPRRDEIRMPTTPPRTS